MTYMVKHGITEMKFERDDANTFDCVIKFGDSDGPWSILELTDHNNIKTDFYKFFGVGW